MDSLDQALECSQREGFDGLEVNIDHPCLEPVSAAALRRRLDRSQQHLILEIVTGGDYTPSLQWSPSDHLAQLDQDLERATALKPEKINLITGSDSWSDPVQDEFLAALLDRIEAVPVVRNRAVGICEGSRRDVYAAGARAPFKIFSSDKLTMKQ